MGGSSKQVTGHRYFANFLLFIGNPIEKVLGINFDKRGWQTPLIDEKKNPLSIGEVKLPNLYGENEGGVAGKIHARYGTENPDPVDFYSSYLAKNDLPPLAYPYQSYLAFKDFYLGNSGYMKEMLLWVKRTRIRNDGREQWYANSVERPWVCEIGSAKTNELSASNFIAFNVLGNFKITWADANGMHFAEGPAAFFPITELDYGYEAASPNNGPKLNEAPGYIAGAKQLIDANIDFDEYCELPAPTWTDYPPVTDGFWGGAIVRGYSASGEFNWAGGDFEFKAVLSNTRSQIAIFKILQNGDKVLIRDLSDTKFLNDYNIMHDTIYLEPGVYSLDVNVGARYEWQGMPRPLIHFGIRNTGPNSSNGVDINPIHKIREILTDDTAMSKPESSVNNENFMKAADRIWDEGLGISWSITEKSCLEAIEELCGHIEAGVRVNRQTGLYEMVLFRDDWFKEEDIHALAVSKIKSMSLEVANADEAINQLNVSYYNRDAIKNSSFSIAENASIRNLNGRVNAEDADFPYFMNQRNAAVVAQWKLKQMSSPVWKGSFTTAEYNARRWNRYDLLKLEWPRKWTGTILVRIMKINLGTGTDVSIDFVEVVPYSSDLSSSIVVDTPVDTTPKPPQPAMFKAFELSYLEAVQLNGQKTVDEALAYNPDAGYAAVIAKRPQSNSLNALMYTDIGNDYERAGAIVYSETAELDQSLSKMDHAFIVKRAGDIDMVSTGTQITVNNEIMVYQSYDEETGLLTVKRGALDTIPQNHVAGSVLYFADDFITVDPTEYVTGEIINVKTLTTTPSGILSLDAVDAQQVEIQARAIRPYPSANVKINDVYWPTEIETDLVLTWVDRNRIQQTGGSILGWYEGGVAIEPGTQTHLILTQLDENDVELSTTSANVSGTTSYTFPISSMQVDVRTIRVVLKTQKNGYECLNPFIHTVELSQFFSAPYDFTVEFKND
ncbi:phage tail protein [Acinetobacter cumulans]|uniref:phage tail protein n=1 Tax=Acinetobacter cumulans TaxID=2136182 RepID=UPI001443D259|nr:phage tail protein [Acinetobacter cumulans]